MNLIETTLKQLKSTDYEASLKLILQHEACSHLIRVKFAYHCANDSFLVTDWKRKEKAKELSNRSLDLVAKWLADSNSVSQEELKKAADAAHTSFFADDAVRYAANTAYNATYSVAYYAAYYAAYSAANVAVYNDAYYSTNAAYCAAKASKNEKKAYKKYLSYLIELVCGDTKNVDKQTINLLYK